MGAVHQAAFWSGDRQRISSVFVAYISYIASARSVILPAEILHVSRKRGDERRLSSPTHSLFPGGMAVFLLGSHEATDAADDEFRLSK